ncbi:MAG: methylmalonyl-CoA epimerase [Rhodospirillaceae bacterium]|jgi:methylmalonyl-CoA/ethylmalonyl-CoA epimerase|nr:methylmalonyl-CoA epimerase [Rhodospirillaceae bacterium]MBT5913372.1 methylmalonyl-CoA epimerase [Rhodospirillaceae bacterium]MBT6307548.1 methylmalonyl-CoA epimerase [Rhodospirillaceae bacterium]
MIGRLNHIAIVVPDLVAAAGIYKASLGAVVSEVNELPEHGVRLIFVELPNCKIELLHPIDDTSPVFSFLEKNPSGGMHHLCYEVEDLYASIKRLKMDGARVLGDGRPKIGAHGKPVVFLHPKDFLGTLIELEQV